MLGPVTDVTRGQSCRPISWENNFQVAGPTQGSHDLQWVIGSLDAEFTVWGILTNADLEYKWHIFYEVVTV